MLDHDPSAPWVDHVAMHERLRRGIDLPAGRVRAAFLLACVGDEVVGRVSIRFALNDWLEQFGGHVGYGVRPAHRRRGYAGEMLRQSLVVARSEGVDRVLVVCDDDNLASAAVLLRGGGVESTPTVDAEGGRHRRFWIP
nr:GNAT family N-acetyltransferase [Angustibacter aerolatus]